MSTTTTINESALSTGTWSIDPVHSEVGFTVRHLGLSKVRGRFNRFDGTVTVGENAAASSVQAAIDLSSVDTNNADRDAHLTSTDFFDVDAHPQMLFESIAVSPDQLDGQLTLNGVTRLVSLSLEFHGVTVDGYGATRAGFSAAGHIKRSDFGIDFNMPVGIDGMLIGDKVEIELEIQAVRTTSEPQ